MKDQETKMKFVELRGNGWSFDRIAQELRVSKQTLIAWGKEFETEIANLRAIELESLQERFLMMKAQRIEHFGNKLQAIKNELDKRNLAELPTDKLFDLLIKYSNTLKNETVETVFKGKELLGEVFDVLGTEVTWKP